MGNAANYTMGGAQSDTMSGYTPSVMSPIKFGTGIGQNLASPAGTIRDATLYSVPSPLRISPIKGHHHYHDPVREVEENIKA